jgi:hypothetical protein
MKTAEELEDKNAQHWLWVIIVFVFVVSLVSIGAWELLKFIFGHLSITLDWI